jgi:hypothetical protein
MKAFKFVLHAALALAVAACSALPGAALAAGVIAQVQAHASGQYTGVNGLGTPYFPIDVTALAQFTAGTGVTQADKLFSDQRTLAASATENLDLAGVLKDPLGATLTFGHVKLIVIIADPGNTNDVVVGGAATNTFVGPFGDATDKVAIKPGHMLIVGGRGAGWAVTPATGDIVLVANSGGTTGVTYKVLIIGTST